MKKLMMAAMVAALGLSAAAAYTPSFAYQGVLRDKNGSPLGADLQNVVITFKVYKSSNGTDHLWSKKYTVSLATNGLFNVELAGSGTNSDGDSTTLDTVAADNSNEDLYIGLTVADSTGEITPRQKLIPSPRALFAQDVKTASGDFTVKGDLTVAGAISMGSTNDTLNAANIWATGTFFANDKATFQNGVQVEGGELKVAGDASVQGTLTVGGMALSMPIGAIMMWSGAWNELPKDGCWVLCDGQTTYAFNGNTSDMRKVPDLRGRFIVGTVGDGVTEVPVQDKNVKYKTGDTGGKNEVALTTDQMPSHRHRYLGDDSLAGHNTDYANDVSGDEYDFDQSSDGKTRGRVYEDQAVGGNQAHENLPPYYALCYIIKVK